MSLIKNIDNIEHIRPGLAIKWLVIIVFIILSFNFTLYYSLMLLPFGALMLFNFTLTQIYKIAFVFILCLFIPSLLTFMLIDLIEYIVDGCIIYNNQILLSFTTSSILLLSVNLNRTVNKSVKKILLYIIHDKIYNKRLDIRLLHTILNEKTIRVFYYFTYFLYAFTIVYVNMISSEIYDTKQFTTFSYSFTIFFAYDRMLKELKDFNYKNILTILK